MKKSLKAEKIPLITDDSTLTYRFSPTYRRSRKRPAEKAVAVRSTQAASTSQPLTEDPPQPLPEDPPPPLTEDAPQLSSEEEVPQPSYDVVLETGAENKHFAYLRLLDENHGVTVVDDIVVMRDADINSMTLKQYQYCVVFMLHSFPCCTCHPTRTSFVTKMRSLAESVLKDQYAACIHIKVATIVKESPEEMEFSASSSNLQKDYPELTPLAMPSHLLVQTSECDFGIIVARGGKLTCGICKSCSKHVRPVTEALESELEVTTDLQWVLENTQEVVFSYPSIVTTKPIGLQDRLNTPLCSCVMQPELSVKSVLVYSEQGSQVKQCAVSRCTHCCETAVDADVSLLPSYAVDNSMLRQYLRLFCTNELSLYGFYKSLCWKVFDATRTNPTLKYIHLRNAWVSFIQHLDFRVEDSFRCDLCENQPALVIGDGIALSYQRRFHRRAIGEETATDNVGLSGLSHSDLVFIDHRPTRHLLSQWVAEGLEDDILHHLHLLLAHHCEQILGCVDGPRCRNEHQWFVTQLSKASPVTALCHPTSLPLLTRMLDGELTAGEHKDLSQISPFLFQTWSENLLTQLWVRQCLQRLAEKCSVLLASVPHPSFPSNLDDRGAFFPHLPAVRNRGKYLLDKQPGDRLCTKNASGHPSLLPGIFTMHCQHSICIGYSVMERFESPNVPFTTLISRFDKAPSTVIYDNACNLAAYCLKRAPGFFKDTRFLIDRFHYRNHTACSNGYNIDMYPQYKEVNTQVAEQSNSCIYRLRGMLSYANEANFHRYIRLFLAYRNSISRARHHMDTQYSDLFQTMAALFKY